MRRMTINLLATTTWLFGAASSSAWSIEIVEATGWQSSTVTPSGRLGPSELSLWRGPELRASLSGREAAAPNR